MKVSELIEVLAKLEPDKELFVASDEEGNSYHTLDEATIEPLIKLDDEAWPLILWPGRRVEDFEEAADHGIKDREWMKETQ